MLFDKNVLVGVRGFFPKHEVRAEARRCGLRTPSEERDGLLCPLRHHLGRADVPSEGGRGREARHDYPSDRRTLRLGVSQGTAWKLSRRYSGER